jgi:transposase-like protein
MDSKTLVIGMAERKGRIHLQVIPNRTAKTLRPVVDSKISPDTERIITDGAPAYTWMFPKDKHEPGNHREELRRKNWTTTQTIENAFSRFKRGIIGQYHQLSPWHLSRYMKEFCWRYNRRGIQPWIFSQALGNMVARKPLPYKTLVKF